MLRGFSRRMLGVPLVAKLIGANVIIVAFAILFQAVAFSGRRAELVTVIAGLAGALVVNIVLVRIALRPIQELEELAHRVSRGEFTARGAPSLLADKELTRLRSTVNDLLDSLSAERERIQKLGALVVEAQDIERAKVSHQLHDSIAQTLAAVRFQLAAASREAQAEEVMNRVTAASAMISSVMEEIMKVSYSLHSRMAYDLGIGAALEALARQVTQRSGLEVKVSAASLLETGATISGVTSAGLYRVAEEALHAIESSAGVSAAEVRLFVSRGAVNIEILDDGGSNEALLTPGLIAVKQRVLLAGGKMSIDTAPSGGTRVSAEIRIMRAAS